MSNYDYNNYNSPSPGPGPNTPHPNRGGGGGNDTIDTISWIVDIGLIFAWFPVGLFLTIAKANGHDFVGSIIRSIRSSSQNRNSGNARTKTSFDVGQTRTTSSRVYGNQSGYSAPTQETRQTQQAEAGKKDEKTSDGIRHADAGSKVLEIIGWVLVGIGALATLGSLGSGIWSILSSLAIALGGGAMVWSGRKAKKKEAAFRRCLTVSGTTGIVKLSGLAKTLGMSEEELEKQLDEMIDRGFYGAKAYLDHARGLLVIEPSDMRYVYQAEDEAKAAQKSAAAQANMSEYDKIIEQIRQADIAIADEGMSEKIRTMQELTAAIFAEVEAHPEKKPQIQRFMNYYLPTTLKLLDSYARIEQQGVSGANMAKAKADIERIADTLVEGYKKQLDTLYRSEAVDIAGDVSVIESMMRRDGLTGQNDFRIKMEDAPAAQDVPAAQDAPAAQDVPAAQDAPAEGQVMGGH